MKSVVPLLVTAVLLLALLLGARWMDSQKQKAETKGNSDYAYVLEGLVEIDGEQYRPRKSITTVLLMGVDQDSSTVSRMYRNGGQADFLRLLLIDHAEKKITQISIDRDTMTPIPILGVLGNRAGMRTAQISLSHGFGDGREQSCELTVEAVSNLLLGVPIDFYVAMNMDGISELNDYLGGVEVTLTDDFSMLDPAMTKGTTLTLMGDQAEYFVRSRMSVGVGTNEARMARQEQYISALTAKLDAVFGTSQSDIAHVYDAVASYLTTNLGRGRLINEAWATREYDKTEVIEPVGVHQVGEDGFMQFIYDEEAMKNMVLELFYIPM